MEIMVSVPVYVYSVVTTDNNTHKFEVSGSVYGGNEITAYPPTIMEAESFRYLKSIAGDSLNPDHIVSFKKIGDSTESVTFVKNPILIKRSGLFSPARYKHEYKLKEGRS